MKQEAHHPAQETYETVLRQLHDRGIRLTETRKAIIAYMIETHDHPSAEMIYKDLRPQYPSMSLATVYNNLRFLVDEGYVAEIKVTNDTTTYYDFMGDQHVNVICESCGKIVDFMDTELVDISKEVYDQTQFKVAKMQLTVYGLCPDCQAKQAEAV